MKINMKTQNSSSNTPVDSNENNAISNINKAPQVIYEEDEEGEEYEESVYDDDEVVEGAWYIFGNMHNGINAIHIKLCIPHSVSDINGDDLGKYIEKKVLRFRKDIPPSSVKQYRLLMPSLKI